MHATLAVGAVVFREDGRVLLVQRGRPPRVGTWSLPGGKVEPGESVTAAVEREVLEEAGLFVDAGPLVDVVTLAAEGFAYEIHEVLCTLRAPEADAVAGDDASSVRWCSDGDLVALAVSAEVCRIVATARMLRTP